MHKKTVAVLLASAATTAVVGLAGSANGATGNPLCFSGDGGSCTREGKSVHLVAPGAGVGYAGTYFNAKSTQGKAPAAVDYSFDYVGDINGGSPRLSIPIDKDGNGGWDDFASLDAQNCGGADGVPGTVSTTIATCPVNLNYSGASYPNWDAFAADAAANGWTIAKKDTPFIIADYDTNVLVSNISFTAP